MLAEEIRRLRQQAEDLRRVQITVLSPGEYPTKSRTPVSDVARYQNDGTEKITPSRFIERAEAEAGDWEDEIDEGINSFIDTGDESGLKSAADEIARDISRVCDRIRTGRLKRSFTGKIETDGRD